jgi:type III secretion protein D
MIDSAPPLRLRILTGRHAGAEISVGQGEHVIGSAPTCDIVISDWTFLRSPFSLSETEDGAYQISFEDTALGGSFGIDEPRSIGQIVVAVSKSDDGSRRPSDLELMTKLLAPPVPVAVARRDRSKWVVAGIIIVAAAAASALTLHDGTHVQAPPHASETPLVKVRNAVGKLRYPSINVTEEEGVVTVSGLVQRAADKQELARSLATVKGVTIQQRYAVEGEIIQAISDAVAQPGIIVRHIHGGRFEIGGEVTPAMRQKIDLARLKDDLGPLVKSLSFAEPRQASESDAEFEEARMKNGYQFKIAADGSKYFIAH